MEMHDRDWGMSVNFSEVLHHLVRDPRWVGDDFAQALHALTEASAQALSAHRVSVWEMAEDASGIRCVSLYDVNRGRHESGAFLAVNDAPVYFAAIQDARVVAVEDALSDPRTCGLAEGYLKPLGVSALLDAPVLMDGKLFGVVCHEVLGGPRAWADAERAFAASIGDMAALAYQSARRRDAESKLRRREKEMRVAMSAARVADWSWDMVTDRIRWSDGVGPMFGRPAGWQPDGLDAYMDLIHPGDRQSVLGALDQAEQQGGVVFVEHRVLSAEGGVHWLQCWAQVQYDPQGKPTGVAGVIADHTERRELEARLTRSERLDSLGRLAGGVAHDFNNLLTAISVSCELLGRDVDDATQQRRLQVIESAADRACKLTGQLLAFSRRVPSAPRPVDLRRVLTEALVLIEPLLGDGIAVAVDAPDAAWVMADGTQMEQVIVNLAINARDAMPDGGTLTYTLRERERSGASLVELTVSDTGVGIPADLHDRIFEPFFTTKTENSGTGLGLAMCHGIVHQSGGSIQLKSRLNRGTTFVVRLPRSEPGQAEGLPSLPPRASNSRRHHALVLEDDPVVASILVDLLKGEGHEVTHMANGDEAMAWLRSGRQPTVVISDLVLEGANGTEVAMTARRLIPDLPMLLITASAPGSLPPALKHLHVLTKPFRAEDILGWLMSLAPSEGSR